MAIDGSEAERIKQSGWRQGSILDDKMLSELVAANKLPNQLPPGYWVVISHDCDVTNPSFDAEPSAEVIFGELITPEKKDGNRQWGKNSRQLQISGPPHTDGTQEHLQFSAHRRAVFSRSILASYRPANDELAYKTVEQLVSWIAKRYVRRAFADTFNDRTRKAINRLRSKLRKDGQLITGIYLLVSDDELEPDQDYDLVVWVAMREEDHEITDKRQIATRLLGIIESELSACDGVTVEESELRSESDVSIADVRRMKRWDFDDLTLREE